MSTIETLSAEQHAVVELVAKRGMSYDRLSEILAIEAGRVSELARGALVQLAPDAAVAVRKDQRGPIADYVLGQQTDEQQQATRKHLKRSKASRKWALSLLGALETLYPEGNRPAIPQSALERAREGLTALSWSRRTKSPGERPEDVAAAGDASLAEQEEDQEATAAAGVATAAQDEVDAWQREQEDGSSAPIADDWPSGEEAGTDGQSAAPTDDWAPVRVAGTEAPPADDWEAPAPADDWQEPVAEAEREAPSADDWEPVREAHAEAPPADDWLRAVEDEPESRPSDDWGSVSGPQTRSPEYSAPVDAEPDLHPPGEQPGDMSADDLVEEPEPEPEPEPAPPAQLDTSWEFDDWTPGPVADDAARERTGAEGDDRSDEPEADYEGVEAAAQARGDSTAGLQATAPRGRVAAARELILRNRMVAAAVAVVAIGALAVVVLTGGDEADAPGGSAPLSGGRPALNGRVVLRPVAGEKGSGVALISERAGRRQIVVQAHGLRPTRSNEAYEIWLFNSPSDSTSVGAQVTDKRGNYPVIGNLPANEEKYKFIDISREKIDSNTKHSRVSVLRGTLPD